MYKGETNFDRQRDLVEDNEGREEEIDLNCNYPYKYNIYFLYHFYWSTRSNQAVDRETVPLFLRNIRILTMMKHQYLNMMNI